MTFADTSLTVPQMRQLHPDWTEDQFKAYAKARYGQINNQVVSVQQPKPTPAAPVPEWFPSRRKQWCEQCEHYCKGCADKCKKANRKVAALTECPLDKWGPSKPRGRKVNAMLAHGFINSQMATSLAAVAEEHGLAIDYKHHSVTYRKRLAETRNVITWGMKLRNAEYNDNGKRNALFIENGLLKQGRGFFVDAEGFFADSAFCTGRAWETPATPEEAASLREIVKGRFGWDLFHGGNPRGPVLVALQMPNDAPLKYYYPAAKGQTDRNRVTLELVRHHFKSRKRIIVRQHPRDKGFDRSRYQDLFRSNWSWDESQDVYALLPTCSMVITVASTTGIEALALGIPVATLGHHVYKGAGVTLECAEDPARLAELSGWQPDRKRITDFLCAILRSELRHNMPADEVRNVPAIQAWLKKAELPKPTRTRSTVDPFTPEILQQLEATGMQTWHPERTPVRVRAHAMAERLREGAKEVVIGFAGLSHLGDCLCTTRIPRKLKEAYPDVTVKVVRHRSTMNLFANNPYVDGFQNANRIGLDLKYMPGKGHYVHRAEAYFGLHVDDEPSGELYLTEEEKAWANVFAAGSTAPIVILSPDMVTARGRQDFAEYPWQQWVDILIESGCRVVQPVQTLAKYKEQAAIHERDESQWVESVRYQNAEILEDLSLRQYLSLFFVASGYLGTHAGGKHAAAAFGLPSLIAAERDGRWGDLDAWQNPQLRHFKHIPVPAWRPYTMLGVREIGYLQNAANQLPEGANVVVAGTWKGGDIIAMHEVRPDLRFHIVDSFEGLAEPVDEDLCTSTAIAGECNAGGLEAYRNTLARLGIDAIIHKIWIDQDSVKALDLASIDMLFLDLDHYQPTHAMLAHCRHRLTPDAIVLTHDYGFGRTPGIKRACDQFGQWHQVQGSLAILEHWEDDEYASFLRVVAEEDREHHELRQWFEHVAVKARIASLAAPRKLVEIGVRAGYSAWAMLRSCEAEYSGYDAYNGQHGGGDINLVLSAIRVIRQLRPDARVAVQDTQRLPIAEPADMYHIDGDHSYGGALSDIASCWESAMDSALLLVDDYQAIPDVRRAVDDFVAQRKCKAVYVRSFRGEALIFKGDLPRWLDEIECQSLPLADETHL